mmetsp:Transcript_19277/g.48186  ORF Transcript_19277/g.48186 Transcript_19277/m.48186 type:complete len:93 (-) Transcript_19277:120-398(-)
MQKLWCVPSMLTVVLHTDRLQLKGLPYLLNLRWEQLAVAVRRLVPLKALRSTSAKSRNVLWLSHLWYTTKAASSTIASKAARAVTTPNSQTI